MTYTELHTQLEQLQTDGYTIEHLEIAEDVQQELMRDLLHDIEPDDCPPSGQRGLLQLKDPTRRPSLGLTNFAGFTVVRRPAGSGIRIVYH
jgi:hypothetical protein